MTRCTRCLSPISWPEYDENDLRCTPCRISDEERGRVAVERAEERRGAKTERIRCPECLGTGYQNPERQHLPETGRTCPVCNGTGSIEQPKQETSYHDRTTDGAREEGRCRE